MSETDKPKLGMRAPLGLKRTVETGKVKQSFSHGRSNTVIVETKRARVLRRPGEPEPVALPIEAPDPEPVVVAAPPPPAEAPRREPAPAPRPQPAPVGNARPLTPLERREQQERLFREADEARMTALEEARRRNERLRAEASEDEKRRAEGGAPPAENVEPAVAAEVPAPAEAAAPLEPAAQVAAADAVVQPEAEASEARIGVAAPRRRAASRR